MERQYHERESRLTKSEPSRHADSREFCTSSYGLRLEFCCTNLTMVSTVFKMGFKDALRSHLIILILRFHATLKWRAPVEYGTCIFDVVCPHRKRTGH